MIPNRTSRKLNLAFNILKSLSLRESAKRKPLKKNTVKRTAILGHANRQSVLFLEE